MKTHPVRYLVLAGLAAILVGGAFYAEGRRSHERPASAVKVRGELGPRTTEVELYAANKMQLLESISKRDPDRRSGGLISFSRRLYASEAASMTDGLIVSAVFLARTGGEPEALLPKAALMEAVAEATGEPDCQCVYAVAVEDSYAGKLRSIQLRPDVRLVDIPDPPAASLRGLELRPLLPEEAQEPEGE